MPLEKELLTKTAPLPPGVVICIDKTGWVLLFGAGGAALGLPIGAMRGHRDVYVIEQEATGTN